MPSKKQDIEEHVGELLSGYLDGELTQQMRQRVELHCDQCGECASNLMQLRALRERVGQSKLGEMGVDQWREIMDDSKVKAFRGSGWLLLIGFGLAGAGFGVWAFIANTAMGVLEKVLVGGIYLGLALLFISVLRQRLIERKTDKYKDVEI